MFFFLFTLYSLGGQWGFFGDSCGGTTQAHHPNQSQTSDEGGSLHHAKVGRVRQKQQRRLPYPCKYCPRTFSTSQGLSRHHNHHQRISSVKPDDKQPEIPQCILALEVPINQLNMYRTYGAIASPVGASKGKTAAEGLDLTLKL